MPLTNYRGLEVLDTASGAGGQAISDNFQKIADRFAYLSTSDPSATDDSSDGFNVGSRWYNTSSNREWICTNSSVGAAVWHAIGGNAFNQSLNTTDSPSFEGLNIDGTLMFSAGTTPAVGIDFGGDTNLYRASADTLKTDDAFVAASLAGAGSAITGLNGSNIASGTVAPARLGSGTATTNTFLRGDGTWATVMSLSITTDNTVLSLSAANGGSSSQVMVLTTAASTGANDGKTFACFTSGETYARGMFYSDGKYGIGPGSATRDVFISRGAANVMKVSSDGASGQADLEVTRGLLIDEIGSAPSSPASGTQARLFVKNNNFVIQFNDSGTTRYRYIPLSGTSVTWTQSTTAP